MLLTFISFLSLSSAAVADAPTEIRAYQSLHLELPYTPSIARIDGQDSLIYELHATNFSARTLTIVSLDIVETASGAGLARVAPEGTMRRIGAQEGNAHSLAPGQHAIFYLNIPWTGRGTAPLSHRITFDAAREGSAPDRARSPALTLRPACRSRRSLAHR